MGAYVASSFLRTAITSARLCAPPRIPLVLSLCKCGRQQGHQPGCSNYASLSRTGNTLYMHVHFWPGETAAMAGLKNQVKPARLMATGPQVKFAQEELRVRFPGLPAKAPGDPVTTPASSVRENRPPRKAVCRRRASHTWTL